MTKYDIFISYRREGGYDTAKHLYDLLDRDGYNVSFDIDTLRNGYFDKELLSRIDQCKDFLLIIDNHCFDRIFSHSYIRENDWLRQELAYALKKDKNIVPIFLHGVSDFPENLPSDIVKIIRRNGPHIVREYFDDFYKKLKARYLESKPVRKQDDIRNNTEIKEVKVVFTSNLPCVIYANGASCCSISGFNSVSKYLYPEEYTFKCVSQRDSTNTQIIKYVVKNIANPQSVKIEFEPTAADLGITQKEYEQWKKSNPGFNPNVTKEAILSFLEYHNNKKKEESKESVKSIAAVIGVIVLIVIAVIMISCGVSVFLALGICGSIGIGVGKATGLIN